MLQIKSFIFSPIAENTYVLYNEAGEGVIIDPGCYFSKERQQLSSYLTTENIQLKYLLNTHCHLDHVFGNKFIYENYQLELYIHANEKIVLEHAPLAGLRWEMPFDNYTGPLHFLRENEVIRLGADELKVIYAPGHSPGHICFYCEKQNFLIGGDVLFKMSIGRTDLPGSHFDTLIKSIQTQLFTLPNQTVVYSGHGQPTTIGFEKENNPYVKKNRV